MYYILAVTPLTMQKYLTLPLDAPRTLPTLLPCILHLINHTYIHTYICKLHVGKEYGYYRLRSYSVTPLHASSLVSFVSPSSPVCACLPPSQGLSKRSARNRKSRVSHPPFIFFLYIAFHLVPYSRNTINSISAKNKKIKTLTADSGVRTPKNPLVGTCNMPACTPYSVPPSCPSCP